MATSKRFKVLSPQPTLASAGTAQAITSSSKEVREATIYAADTNTGNVYIGMDNTTAKNGVGIVLAGGESMDIRGTDVGGTQEMVDLSSIFFDGGTTGNKLVVLYLE